ncbi:uncharacterized protein LOC111940205 [Cyanistes caeruleus]|uniref:uncharacterized protein LOC111940205 n=1 Tax=Cyanistes caeruleus TaxID=156563 RepID=UPI000CDB75C8|nr:uncharacterized protein LOC111940205 [Cyanistes caeruleus]
MKDCTSADEQLAYLAWQDALPRMGLSVSEDAMRALFQWVKEQGFDITMDNAFDLETWSSIGDYLWSELTNGDTSVGGLAATWGALFKALKRSQSEDSETGRRNFDAERSSVVQDKGPGDETVDELHSALLALPRPSDDFSGEREQSTARKSPSPERFERPPSAELGARALPTGKRQESRDCPPPPVPPAEPPPAPKAPPPAAAEPAFSSPSALSELLPSVPRTKAQTSPLRPVSAAGEGERVSAQLPRARRAGSRWRVRAQLRNTEGGEGPAQKDPPCTNAAGHAAPPGRKMAGGTGGFARPAHARTNPPELTTNREEMVTSNSLNLPEIHELLFKPDEQQEQQ